MNGLKLSSTLRRTVRFEAAGDGFLTIFNEEAPATYGSAQQHQVRTFTKAQAEQLRDFLNAEYPKSYFVGLDLAFMPDRTITLTEAMKAFAPPKPPKPKEGTRDWFLAEAKRLGVSTELMYGSSWHVSNCSVCRKFRNRVRAAIAKEQETLATLNRYSSFVCYHP